MGRSSDEIPVPAGISGLRMASLDPELPEGSRARRGAIAAAARIELSASGHPQRHPAAQLSGMIDRIPRRRPSGGSSCARPRPGP